jgi:hypothetical protein
MNPLYNLLGNVPPIIKQFQQFKNNFRGDPRQQIQQMLNSGKITQQQYNNAVQMAQQLSNLLR